MSTHCTVNYPMAPTPLSHRHKKGRAESERPPVTPLCHHQDVHLRVASTGTTAARVSLETLTDRVQAFATLPLPRPNSEFNLETLGNQHLATVYTSRYGTSATSAVATIYISTKSRVPFSVPMPTAGSVGWSNTLPAVSTLSSGTLVQIPSPLSSCAPTGVVCVATTRATNDRFLVSSFFPLRSVPLFLGDEG